MMAHIETLTEIVEGLAVSLDVGRHGPQYVTPLVRDGRTVHSGPHTPDCSCRPCWCVRMEVRIRNAVEFERVRQALSDERTLRVQVRHALLKNVIEHETDFQQVHERVSRLVDEETQAAPQKEGV